MELRQFDAAIGHLKTALATLDDLGLHLDTAMALNCLGEATCAEASRGRAPSRWSVPLSSAARAAAATREARALHHLALAAAELSGAVPRTDRKNRQDG
ncbi:hypothetical protein [Streptomyces sp. VNUA24]|uniref:hypothetical protein n=1 Tax=Streptomyces sp. VNUA24 TaxID=3031131 RepID=UPI0023B7F1BF|nr:hypothetical protein [Streptomyces sp. VNUA24]WEH12220.1 hypothetical protein PYR72_00270 [Streptomyces sp. VNUA24]